MTDVIEFGRKVNELKQMALFQEVILDGYIKEASEIALDFEDTLDQREKLLAVSHLVRWMQTAEDEAVKLLDNNK